MVVDTAEGVISNIQAYFADGRDSQYLTDISLQVQDRLRKNELIMTDFLADAGYSNGANYNFLERRKVTGWIPVFGKYKPEIEGFPYDKEKDEYSCPMNRHLPFKGFYTNRDGSVLKRYWTAPKDCKACPMKSQCVPNSKCKKITRTIYDEQYLRAYGRQHSEKGKRMKNLRQSTVEPVFGSLTQFYGLRKIGVLGKAGAHKVMLMAAIAFNLKTRLNGTGRSILRKEEGSPHLAFSRRLWTHSKATWPSFCRQIRPRPVILKAS